jgi:hypothetical protein
MDRKRSRQCAGNQDSLEEKYKDISMKCLSVCQTWASCICPTKEMSSNRWYSRGGLPKDVENRLSWRFNYTGPLLIHASKRVMDDSPVFALNGKPCGLEHFPRGAIIGLVILLGVRSDSSSPWSEMGQQHLTLKHILTFERPVPWKGQQGLFDVPVVNTPEVLPFLATLWPK